MFLRLLALVVLTILVSCSSLEGQRRFDPELHQTQFQDYIR